MRILIRAISVVAISLAMIGTADAASLEKSWWKAIEKGKTARVEKLLQKGADVDLLDGSGRTGLVLSAGLGHAELVRLLISNGADVNYSVEGASALSQAIRKGDSGIVRDLVNAGAIVDRGVIWDAESKGSETVIAVVGRVAPVIFSASMICRGQVLPKGGGAYFSNTSSSWAGKSCEAIGLREMYRFQLEGLPPPPIRISLRYAPPSVTWSSSDPVIASISPIEGLTAALLAKDTGTATIEAKVDGQTVFRLKTVVRRNEGWGILLKQLDPADSGSNQELDPTN